MSNNLEQAMQKKSKADFTVTNIYIHCISLTVKSDLLYFIGVYSFAVLFGSNPLFCSECLNVYPCIPYHAADISSFVFLQHITRYIDVEILQAGKE